MEGFEKQFGAPVPGWTPPLRPSRHSMKGRYVALDPLEAELHGDALHDANSADAAIWDYLPYGPFATVAEYKSWIRDAACADDPLFFAVRVKATQQYAGVLSFLRIAPQAGSIEVGHINFARTLQRTAAATEAIFLMMQWAFEAGYRRFEWKCDALNRGSRRAAQRFGFSYEGVFRQATIYKGRNRDTAWFACIDAEWPALKEAYLTWLSPENIDASGRQLTSLADLTSPILVARDPLL
ncbi:MAG: GNAT family protein [Pseudomonadota bacterium]